jgi:FkbM family methyltransferase
MDLNGNGQITIKIYNMQTFSQNNEQQYILSHFDNIYNGKYCEIGSFHPTIFSNTRALFEKGWNGVLVEPSPICIKSLKKEYENEPRITIVEAAITNKDGVVTFYESGGDAVGSTSLNHKEKWEAGFAVTYEEITVNSISMETFLKEFGENIDFLNLDVESTNIELFNLIPDWFWERLSMLCIEHDNQQDYIISKLQPFGFKELHRNGENLILAK